MRTGVLGGRLGYRVLRAIAPDGGAGGRCTGAAYRTRSKIETLLGADTWARVAGKVVLDFGCGEGADAVELARRGAARVVGVDIRPGVLAVARRAARAAGVHERCVFTTRATERADVVVSLDGFEHYGDPAGVLATMRDLLVLGGRILVAFGPTWLHPLGGHLFSVFPWAHLVFTERALLRWRGEFKPDGATRFGEVDGGLNQMTVRRFRRLVDASGLTVHRFETVPIRGWRPLVNPLTRELFTAVVRCELAHGGR